VAFEAGCDGFWLARWMLAGGFEAYDQLFRVSREIGRAKTDRLDTQLLMRSAALAAWRGKTQQHGGDPDPG